MRRSANKERTDETHTAREGGAARRCVRDHRLFEARRDVAGKAVVRRRRKTKPVTAPGESLGAQTDEEGLGANASPAITGPASFADGQAAYQAKKYSEATAIFEAYTERRPGNAWGYYMLGLSAWKSGDFAKSEQAFDKALSIDPRHVKSLVNLSRVLHRSEAAR